MSIELAKTNLYVVEAPLPGVLLSKTNMYVVDNGQPEGPTAEFRTATASFQVPSSAAPDLAASQAVTQSAVDALPDLRTSSAALTVPVVQEKTFQASKAAVQVVCRGRPELAYVRAWTATLDGHDLYFLQLQDLTLVYDFHSEKWYNWGTAGRDLWRAQIGIDWNANLGEINGGLTGLGATSILVGDYALGSLYFLHTGLDEDVGPDGGTELVPFQRVVYGQIPVRGHDFISCNGVELAGSIGETSGAADMTVKLRYSDDAGHNFADAGAITLDPSQYSFTVQWAGLGSFKGPGRLFRIEDWGAITRIDGLDMDDGK